MPYFTLRFISLSPVFIRVNLNLSTLLATFKIQVFISGLSRLPLQNKKKEEQNIIFKELKYNMNADIVILVGFCPCASGDLFDLLSLSIVYKWKKNKETS